MARSPAAAAHGWLGARPSLQEEIGLAQRAATPYDDDSDSRAAYLLGFRKGVNRGLRDGKNITIVCFLKPETRQEEAWIKGFETGRRIVDGRISEIYEEIGRELASEAESLR